MKKTAVLIHGAWMVPANWDGFKKRFETAGYEVLTPTWPYMDRPLEELRTHPADEFGRLTVGQIADHYEAIIRQLPQPPLLVGHSFGGLIVQMLLDRGVGCAGVAIDPGPIAGLFADPVSLAAAFPVLARWNGWNRPFMLSKKAFDTKFANTAPQEQRDVDYPKYVVPCPGRIFYQAASWIGTGVTPAKRKQPLLLISATEDKTVAPYLVKAAYNKQKKSSAKTDFKSFANRSHYLCAEPGWEEVCDSSINWANEVSPN
jgi:pimeloyl-ACP methyl ester carboxylesterase